MSYQTYALHIINNSGHQWDMCLYQRGPDVGPGRFPIAWRAKPVADSAKVTFRWSVDDWGFVWAETGELAPGTLFDTAQTWPADPAIHRPATAKAAGNCVGLTLADRAYLFSSPSAEPIVPAGHVQVMGDRTVRKGQVSVGISNSGAAVLATQCSPSEAVDFAVRPSYFVAAGSYAQGEVLDTAPIPNSPEVVFPADTDSMTAVLKADGRWSIEPSADEVEDSESRSGVYAEQEWSPLRNGVHSK